MIAGFDLARHLAPHAYQPSPGDECEVTVAGIDDAGGKPRWWRVVFASAVLGTLHLAPLEPDMPLGTVTGIRPLPETN